MIREQAKAEFQRDMQAVEEIKDMRLYRKLRFMMNWRERKFEELSNCGKGSCKPLILDEE